MVGVLSALSSILLLGIPLMCAGNCLYYEGGCNKYVAIESKSFDPSVVGESMGKVLGRRSHPFGVSNESSFKNLYVGIQE